MAASPSQPYRVDWRNRPTDFEALNQGLSGVFDHADQMFQELYGRVARLASASSTSGATGTRGLVGPPGFDGQDGEDGFLGYGRSPYGSLQALANGGTGTPTIFTAGSIVFAGTGGVYTQDNAHLFWDDTNDRLGVGVTAPSAVLHLKAGTATASTAPIKLTSGPVLTSPEVGTLEFTTDDFFATITTGTARKAFVLDDGTRLTSGKIPIATTNGRLINLTASSAYTPTNVTTDRSYDANATTLDELADIVGTIIADLQTKGILG